MQVHTDSNDSSKCILEMGDDFTIYAIETIKSELDSVVSKYASITANLSKVEEFDSSGIQVLLSMKLEMARKNKLFVISESSPPVNDLLTLYGLTGDLEVRGSRHG